MTTTPSQQSLVILECRPGKLVWFPLLVLFSSWYSVIWMAWWLATPTPDFSFLHYDAYVHFGVITGAQCLWIQMLVTKTMPQLDRHFYVWTTGSTCVVFSCALLGPGSRFCNFDLLQLRFLGSWPNAPFLYHTLLSLLVVLLAGIVTWALLSVFFKSPRFTNEESFEERQQSRISRLLFAVACVLAILPMMASLREAFPIHSVSEVNRDAYKLWLLKIFMVAMLLWVTCRIAAFLGSRMSQCTVLIVIPWLAWGICWIYRAEYQRHSPEMVAQNLLAVLGFLLIWTLAVLALWFDQLKLVVAAPQFRAPANADPSRESTRSTHISQIPYPVALPRFVSIVGFLVAVSIGNQFPVYYEPITLILPRQGKAPPLHNDQVFRANHIAGFWECSSGETEPLELQNVIATLKIQTGPLDQSWSLAVPIERALDPKFIKLFSSVENINLTIYVTAKGPSPDSEVLWQIHEIKNDSEESAKSRIRETIQQMRVNYGTLNP